MSIIALLKSFYFTKNGALHHWGFSLGSSCSTANLLTVVSYRIARALNKSGAVAHFISKTFDRVWHTTLLQNLKPYEISGQLFGLISSFLSNRRLWVILHGKSFQEYSVNAGASFLILHFSYCTLVTFLMMSSIIFLSMLMILFSTL